MGDVLPYILERVTSRNVKALQEICIQTFSDTYEHLNTPGNFKKYVEEHFNTGQLGAELENPESFTFFLKHDDLPVGYLKLNTGSAQTEDMGSDALEVERIYVLKAFQGKSAGRFLIKKAISLAKEMNKKIVWLGVWEKNEKAMSFYEKSGFIKFDKHFFMLGDDEQIDHLYKFIL